VLTSTGVSLSAPIAAFFDEPRVAPLVAVASTMFLIGALGAVQSALLQRAFRFRTAELCTMAAGIVGASCAIAAALAWHSAWALVVQPLVGMTLGVALVWAVSGWRPRATFSYQSLRELGGYGLQLLGSRTFFTLHRNADNIIVGKALGASALGAYGVAYNLMMLPFKRLVDPVRSILFPIVSRMQDDPTRVKEWWIRSTRALAAVLLPAMVGLALVADDLIAVTLGSAWQAAVTPLRILTVVGVLHAFISVNSTVISALGHARELLRFSILTFTASVLGFLIGVRWGIDGVAAGYLVANLIVVPLYLRLLARVLGQPLGALPRSLGGVVLATTGMAAVVLGTRVALEDAPDAVRLVSCVVAGAASAAILVIVAAPAVRRDAHALLSRSAREEESTSAAR
jgi:PST family polysaccharide transporter